MNEGIALGLVYDGVFLIILIVGALIVPGMLVGLVVSVIQAATQVNEQTLSFLPRLMVTLSMVIVAGPWIVEKLVSFFDELFFTLPGIIG